MPTFPRTHLRQLPLASSVDFLQKEKEKEKEAEAEDDDVGGMKV